jgi:hypothetical protein
MNETLFYDYYLSMVESGAYFHEELANLGVIPGSPEYRGMIRRTTDLLGQSRIVVLSQEVVKFVLDLVEKSGSNAVPYLPYPRIPLWVEFERTRVGDTEVQFSCIWGHRYQGRILLQLLDHLGGSKDLSVEGDSGAWEYMQMGPCSSRACPYARLIPAGATYAIQKQMVPQMLGEYAGCACAQGARTWANLVFLVGHLFQERPAPFMELKITRERPIPKSASWKIRQELERYNALHPNYYKWVMREAVEVSIQSVLPSTHTVESQAPASYVEMKREVSGSWRVLIPGDQKPWKRLQVFHVDAYERNPPRK